MVSTLSDSQLESLATVCKRFTEALDEPEHEVYIDWSWGGIQVGGTHAGRLVWRDNKVCVDVGAE